MRNQVVYTTDSSAEALNAAMLAYEARKRGESTYTAPSKLASVGRVKDHDKHCEGFISSSFLHEQRNSGHGYGIVTYPNGSLAMLNFADMGVSKFKSAEMLPLDIQSKLAMFKVITINEPYSHLGCRFDNDMYYIVAGDMNLDN
jgi:hypothetical protein